jgi:enoyl-CoA hydratase
VKRVGGLVRIERTGCVATLTLDAPETRNALSRAMVTAINDSMDELEADASILGVVVSGNGPAFCAGAEFAILEQAAMGDFLGVQMVYSGFLRFLASPLVTVAAVNGAAVGAGMNVALACDIRLAGPGAVFDPRFARLGLHPGGGHTWLLARAVGQQQATRAVLFGDSWDADGALRVGLVSDRHDTEELLPRAIELASRLEGQDRTYVETVVRSLRLAPQTLLHRESHDSETILQKRSAESPRFRATLAALRQKQMPRQ